MHYKNAKVAKHNPYEFKGTPLVAVATLQVDIYEGDTFVRTHERELLLKPDGQEAFTSWWDLARQFQAI
jgi:hypothetical protein